MSRRTAPIGRALAAMAAKARRGAAIALAWARRPDAAPALAGAFL
ncbi:MAG TPA: hypothetical protein PLI66_00610 [Spirochaetales bacterium]|nr:hypothetical protein [Spirochaetales bacterium]